MSGAATCSLYLPWRTVFRCSDPNLRQPRPKGRFGPRPFQPRQRLWLHEQQPRHDHYGKALDIYRTLGDLRGQGLCLLQLPMPISGWASTILRVKHEIKHDGYRV
jgi:hypothetical protein